MSHLHDQSQARKLLIALAAILSLGCVVACDDSKAPEAPAAEEGSTKKKTEKKKAKSEGSEELGGSSEAEDEADSTEKELKTEPKTFDFGGAKVGDEDTQDEVKKCHDKKKLFDRFEGDTGKCSALNLAKVDCNAKGLKAILSAKQKTQFEDSVGGSYAGWSIDQCGDCPPDGDSALCKSSSGSKQTGTKVFFVKEENDEIRGKAMVLPVRPFQDTEESAGDDGEKDDKDGKDGGDSDS